MVDRNIISKLGLSKEELDRQFGEMFSQNENDFLEEVLQKKELFKELDRVAPLTTPLATNTSTIPITLIAEATKHPERVLGLHFFGPVPMMKAVADFTRGYQIKTIVSVNPSMVDATGMCGACRCSVAGKTVFGCVDGPDFDGHQLDFDELEKRLSLFKEQEGQLGS